MWYTIKNDLKALSIPNCITDVYDLTQDEAELLMPQEQAVGLHLMCTTEDSKMVEHRFWILDNGRIEIASMRGHLRGSNNSETLRQKIERLKKNRFSENNRIADQNDLDAWFGVDMPLFQSELIEEVPCEFVSDPKCFIDCVIFETVAKWYTQWYLGSIKHSLKDF
jgi:hypothetical protein